MSTRIYNGIEWLRERGSWPLLAAIVLLSTVTMLLIDDEGVARPVTLVALALLGGPYANFAKAEFKGAKLYAAYLHNAELGEAHFDPPHARQPTDLRYAQFRGASAVGAHFEGADLGHALFTPSKVRPTVLRGAHFNSRAELRTNLEGAVFDGADLTGAHLEGATLRDVNFDRATLTGWTYDPRTVWPAGFYAPPDRTVLE